MGNRRICEIFDAEHFADAAAFERLTSILESIIDYYWHMKFDVVTATD